MPDVLRGPAHSPTAHTLKVPDGTLDPATEHLLAKRTAAAEQRGWQAGYEQGCHDTAQHLESLTATISERLEALHDELRRQRADATRCHVEVAARLAEEVLDRTPPDDALTVLRRVEQALEIIDDKVTVRLHPDDANTLAEHLPGVTIGADDTVTQGDAHLEGPVASASITRTLLLQATIGVADDTAPCDRPTS